VLVFRHLETFYLAVARASNAHGNFELEIDKAFQDTRRIADRAPRCGWVAAFRTLHLTLSIVPELARLEHCRPAYGLHAAKPLRCAVTRCVRCRCSRQRVDEILLGEAILRRL